MCSNRVDITSQDLSVFHLCPYAWMLWVYMEGGHYGARRPQNVSNPVQQNWDCTRHIGLSISEYFPTGLQIICKHLFNCCIIVHYLKNQTLFKHYAIIWHFKLFQFFIFINRGSMNILENRVPSLHYDPGLDSHDFLLVNHVVSELHFLISDLVMMLIHCLQSVLRIQKIIWEIELRKTLIS